MVNKYHDLTGQILEEAPGRFNIAPETKWSPELAVIFKPTEETPDDIARIAQKPGLVNRNQFAWSLIRQGFRIGEKPNVELIRSKVPESMHDYFDMGSGYSPQALQASAKTAGQTLYHVTRTEKVPKIKAKGILPLQTSNWTKGEGGERYGEGEIYAFDNLQDAVRWAAKMDWDFNQQMGSGKISIVEFDSGNLKWEIDENDPISQATAKGNWLKAHGSVKPAQIKKAVPVTIDMTRAVVQGKDVALDGGMEKEAVTIMTYGMGQPIGGTESGNPDPDDSEDVENAEMNMTSSLEEELSKIASTDDTGWWAKSARPTEQKIQLLQKQLGLTPEQIELCIQADPSPQQKDFVASLGKWLAKGLIKLPEDAAKLKQQLDLFDKLKKSPKFTGNKDIQTYTPETLFETVEANQEAVSKKEKTRQTVTKGSEIIVKDGNLTIYKVTEPGALMQLSGGTNWCTAHANHSTRYLKSGPSYVFFKDNSAFAQLHPSSDQLMNRQDVCMVQEIDTGDTVAKFVDDPTALRGLQLLSAKEPNVAEWVKANATDQETLIKVLGIAMEKEKGKGTERRDMAAQYAITKGEPLDPQEEEMLPKRVPLKLLMRYGLKFHAGAPWEPLAKAILAGKDREGEITDYANEFLKARWPQGEKKLLQKAFKSKDERYTQSQAMAQAIDYAIRAIKGRWPNSKLHSI